MYVDIIDRDKVLVMQVRDNGKGIAEKEAKNNLSLGVLGMRERAQMWGGEVAIAGVESKGTAVTTKIKSD